MELKIPKRHVFGPTLSNVIVQRVLWWERQKRFSCCKYQRTVVEKWCFDMFYCIDYFVAKCLHIHEEERRRRFPKLLFSWHISNKPTRPFFGAWSLLLIQVQCTPSQGPIDKFKKQEQGSVTMEKCHTSLSHFIISHDNESPWPLHFKHSHRWKRWSLSKFASHYTRGTNKVCECKMDVKSTCIPTWF